MDSNRFEKRAKLRYNTLGVIPQVPLLRFCHVDT